MAINKQLGNKVPGYLRQDTAAGVKIDAGPYIGIVMNNIDPTRSGRMQVWIPDLGGERDQPENWRLVFYASPFMGQTHADPETLNNSFKDVPHSYGFWMVPPDVGVQVLVTFVAGDPSRGYWFACIPPELGHHMVPAIASSTFVDDSTEEVIDPLVKQTMEADPPGSGYPVADFNPTYWETADNAYEVVKPIHEIQYKILLEQGLIKDSSRGTHSSSSQRESPSTVFGFSTPGRPIATDPSNEFKPNTSEETKLKDYAVRSRRGGHVLVMDDGEFPGGDRNRLIKLRSGDGHQILLNDSEDIIYIVNAKGTSWIEMTGDGQINMYTDAGFNVRTQGTLNLHADLDININAGRKLNISSGDSTQIDAKDVKFRAVEKFLVSAGSTLGIKTSGSLDLSAGGPGSFGVSGALTLCGSCVGINSGSAPSVETPTAIKLNSLPGSQKDSGVWKIKPGMLTTIVTIAPTHEPFERIPGRSSTATASTVPTPGAAPVVGGTAGTGTIVAGGESMIDIATAFIAKEEGLPAGGKAYYDPPKSIQDGKANFNGTYLYSIGYGHQIKAVELSQGYIQCGTEQVKIASPVTNTTMTKDQATVLLKNDIPTYVTAAKGPMGASWDKLGPTQQAALVSYTYNTGSTRSLVSNGITTLILQDQIAAAGALITTKGIKTASGKVLPALERRRSAETSLWNTVA